MARSWVAVLSTALVASGCGGLVEQDTPEGTVAGAGGGPAGESGGTVAGGTFTGGTVAGGTFTGGTFTGGTVAGGTFTGGWGPGGAGSGGSGGWPFGGSAGSVSPPPGGTFAGGGGGEGGVADPCGVLACNGLDCCEAILVPGGEFAMGRGRETCDSCTQGCPSGQSCTQIEEPEHPVFVSDFFLDRFEVTVGRFRAFVVAFGEGWRPAAGAGAHRALELAAGLAPGTSGWQSSWDDQLPADEASLRASLSCNSAYQTWTDTPLGNEAYAVNCVNWYEALAFCVWDGGRLPTEAEWEYAAAGGDENRLFPWGDDATAPFPANYANHVASPFVVVGSEPLGNGRWGHSDLAGNLWEWALDWHSDDWYESVGDSCIDCANLTPGTDRVIRGGEFLLGAGMLRAAARFHLFDAYEFLESHYATAGVRCAHDASE